MRGGDPSQFFDMLAKGKDVITRDSLDPMFQRMFDGMAQRMGVTNGQITREQFMEQAQRRMNGGGGPGGPGGPMSLTVTKGPDGAPAFDMNRVAEDRFRQLDKDSDGLLKVEEMPESLKAERDKWDANKDGFIDLYEYKEYFKARMQQAQQERGPDGASPGGPADPGAPGAIPSPADDHEEKRPTVYRAGKLPKDMPPWFAQLDTDGDGQVGLYEWVKGGRPVDEFRKMNRNGDGFLTVDDVLRYMKLNKSNGEGDAVASAAPGGPGMTFMVSPNPGGGPSADGGNRGMFGVPGGGPRGNRGNGGPGGFGPRGDKGGNGGEPGMSRGNRGNRGDSGGDQGNGGGRGNRGGGFGPGGGRGQRGFGPGGNGPGGNAPGGTPQPQPSGGAPAPQG
jgi:hypothetical protein